ncbi:MAG: TRAP transporter small permease [Oceanospirillaceae bacterium]|nr:TRAP transporter small permease [Oceanospirillaceae bacterium]
MNLFIRLVEIFSKLLGYIAAFFLMLGVLVVCHMVFTRFVLNAPTSWQTEFVTYILLASTFLGAPWVLLTRGHVNVELLPLMLKARSRFVLCIFAYSSSALLCFILSFYSIEFWYEAWDAGWSSDTMWGPKLWKAYLAMPIGFFAISLQYLVELICLVTGRTPPFGITDTKPNQEIVEQVL